MRILILAIALFFVRPVFSQTSIMLRGGGFSQGNEKGIAPLFDVAFHPARKAGGVLGLGVGYAKLKEASAFPLFLQAGYMGRPKKVNPSFAISAGYAIMNKLTTATNTRTSTKGGFYTNVAGGVQLKTKENSGILIHVGHTLVRTKTTVSGASTILSESSASNGGLTLLVGISIN